MEGRRGCGQQLQNLADITPVDCDPSRPANSAQSAIRRRKKLYFSPFTPKAGMLYGGLLAGCRRGCSQQLLDHAVITPVDCDSPRPADLAQSAPRREKKLSFSPFTPKAGMLYGGLLAGCRRGCSQQFQDQAIITRVDCDPSRPANLAQSAPRREKKLSFSPVTQKAGMLYGGLRAECSQGCSQQ